MRIHYGILSQGQGHLVRSAAVVAALRSRGHRVEVLVTGAPPPAYAGSLLGAHELEVLPNLALDDGALDVGRTLKAFVASVPRRLAAVARVRRRLARKGIDLVLTDFEPISAAAACLAGVPSAGVAGQYRVTRTDCPGPPASLERISALAVMEAWTPGLERYFAVSFAPARATRPRTEVIGPIVDEAVRCAHPTREGFRLAYLYTYPRERVIAALRPHGRFRVYGLGAGPPEGGLEFCATDRAAFVRDLAACEGVVLNGSFQGVCEAAVLGKPVLSIPFGGQYEERFNAHLVERSGLGVAASRLSAEAVARLPRALERTAASVAQADGLVQLLGALGP